MKKINPLHKNPVKRYACEKRHTFFFFWGGVGDALEPLIKALFSCRKVEIRMETFKIKYVTWKNPMLHRRNGSTNQPQVLSSLLKSVPPPGPWAAASLPTSSAALLLCPPARCHTPSPNLPPRGPLLGTPPPHPGGQPGGGAVVITSSGFSYFIWIIDSGRKQFEGEGH